MDPFQVGALQEVLTTLIVACSALTGLWLFLKHRRPRGGEVSEVHDRLDFTERLLAPSHPAAPRAAEPVAIIEPRRFVAIQ